MGYGIMKIVNVNYHIGSSWLATILWYVVRTSVVWSAALLEPNLFYSLLKNQRNMESTILLNNLISLGYL